MPDLTVILTTPNEAAMRTAQDAITLYLKDEVFDLEVSLGDALSLSIVGKNISLSSPARFGSILDIIERQILQHNRPAHIQIGNAMLDTQRLTYKSENQEKPVKLTEKEVEILLFLHEQATMVPRDDLLKHVWGFAEGLETHTAETHIYRLRQKIETDPANPEILVTKDEGYLLQS